MAFNFKSKYEGQGVYAIICIRKMKCYIGSSQDIYKRVQQHKNQLKKGKHYIKELQKDFDKGHDLDVIILEKTNFHDKRYLLLHEYTAMYKMLCDDFHLYNTMCVKGNNYLEKRDYLANTITHLFSVLYTTDTHYKLDKYFHGLSGYKISYSHYFRHNKNIDQE